MREMYEVDLRDSVCVLYRRSEEEKKKEEKREREEAEKEERKRVTEISYVISLS